MMAVNVEKLILLVEKRPALYNTRIKEYGDNNLKKKLWLEVCEEFVGNWMDLGDKEKNEKGQELQRKWKNLRTCFKREYDAQKNQPSGSAPKRRKYLYFEQLLFLRDSLECRNTSSSLEHTNIDLNESASEEASPKADCPPKPSSTRKSRKHSTSRSFEESLLQILQDKRDEEKDIDEDKYFLLSLLPAFRRFNDDQKFYARTEIMNIMRRVRQSGSQNQMQTPYVLDQTNSQASASQYFSTFVPRGQFQELLPPAAITSQNVWENTSTSPQF